jgi:hypothetical protein
MAEMVPDDPPEMGKGTPGRVTTTASPGRARGGSTRMVVPDVGAGADAVPDVGAETEAVPEASASQAIPAASAATARKLQ